MLHGHPFQPEKSCARIVAPRLIWGVGCPFPAHGRLVDFCAVLLWINSVFASSMSFSCLLEALAPAGAGGYSTCRCWMLGPPAPPILAGAGGSSTCGFCGASSTCRCWRLERLQVLEAPAGGDGASSTCKMWVAGAGGHAQGWDSTRVVELPDALKRAVFRSCLMYYHA